MLKEIKKEFIAAMVFSFPTALFFGRDIPPNDPVLQYRGCPQVNATAKYARFDRLLEVPGGFRYDPSGARICFRTNATSIVARLRGNQLHTRRDAVSGVGVWFVDGKRRGTYSVNGATTDEVRVPMLREINAAARNIEIWLPYGDAVDFVGLTVNDEAQFISPPVHVRPRYLAYGDSITHGFRASDPTLTYPALLVTTNDWELINLGFGGREATASDGRLIGSAPADVITILIGFNDHYGNKPLEQYKTDVAGMLKNIRAAQPTTPIWLITPLWSTEPLPTQLGLHLEDYRKVLREIVTEANDPRLHLIEGTELIPADPSFCASKSAKAKVFRKIG